MTLKEINLEKLSQVLVHVTTMCEQERPWKHYLYSKTQKPRKHPWTGGQTSESVFTPDQGGNIRTAATATKIYKYSLMKEISSKRKHIV